MRFSLLSFLLVCSVGCRQKDALQETGDVTTEETALETGLDSGDTSSETGIDTGEVIDEDGDGAPASVDCDDTDATSFPGAEEVCDGADNDCDGTVDNDATDAATFFADVDGDGFGDDAATTTGCALPTGYSVLGGDCDDADPTYHPGASEADCTDPADYNCDGSVGYADVDGDGHAACEDCDDADAAVNDAAAETCNGIDDDCDGLADSDDPDVIDASTWYGDADGDGHGGQQFTQDACDAPAGYVASSDDCNDLDPATYPGASETCDLADNDCDNAVDEGVESTWYADADGDGYGDAASTTDACTLPPGYSWNGDDCNDAAPGDHPGGLEVCDGADNDCDGTADEADALDAQTWYADTDADGYGESASAVESCAQPTGYVSNATDCDDAVSVAFPGGTEVCDGNDNDCDGAIDESDAQDASTWYADNDNDGFGDPSSATQGCSQPSGYVPDATDCDDAAAAVNTGATEVCDSVDNNCDGTVDEDSASDAATWYPDTDGDGYGDASAGANACTQPSGSLADNADCDDSNGSVHPGATELCGDGLDNDCDGTQSTDPLGHSAGCAATDCSTILAAESTSTTGTYWIDPAGAGAFQVECDMDTSGGGWTRIVTHDFSADTCPGDWAAHGSEPLCYRNTSAGGGEAKSASFPTLGVTWSEVLGSIRARQYHSMDAFGQSRSGSSVEDLYVDGISVTAGVPGSRDHLFSFGVGISTQNNSSYSCPAQTGPAAQGFVGSNYLCESGNTASGWTGTWYSPDLFDGQWFEVDRGGNSTEDVEVRLMSNQSSSNEDVGVEWMEIYVR